MICLACGSAQKGEVGAKCPKCDFEHGRVDGIHGVNNVTQLFTTLEDFRNGRCDLDTLLERFDTFAGKWDGFQKRWIDLHQLWDLCNPQRPHPVEKKATAASGFDRCSAPASGFSCRSP